MTTWVLKTARKTHKRGRCKKLNRFRLPTGRHCPKRIFSPPIILSPLMFKPAVAVLVLTLTVGCSLARMRQPGSAVQTEAFRSITVLVGEAERSRLLKTIPSSDSNPYGDDRLRAGSMW